MFRVWSTECFLSCKIPSNPRTELLTSCQRREGLFVSSHLSHLDETIRDEVEVSGDQVVGRRTGILLRVLYQYSARSLGNYWDLPYSEAFVACLSFAPLSSRWSFRSRISDRIGMGVWSAKLWSLEKVTSRILKMNLGLYRKFVQKVALRLIFDFGGLIL